MRAARVARLFFLINQSGHCFLVTLLPLPSFLLKPPNFESGQTLASAWTRNHASLWLRKLKMVETLWKSPDGFIWNALAKSPGYMNGQNTNYRCTWTRWKRGARFLSWSSDMFFYSKQKSWFMPTFAEFPRSMARTKASFLGLPLITSHYLERFPRYFNFCWL